MAQQGPQGMGAAVERRQPGDDIRVLASAGPVQVTQRQPGVART